MVINTSIAPRCKAEFRQLRREIGVEDPLNLLEAGRFIQEFPGMKIYIGHRDGFKLRDIVVYEIDESGPVRNVRAEYGLISQDKTNKVLDINLFNVRIDQRDKSKSTVQSPRSNYINVEEYPVRMDLGKAGSYRRPKKPSGMPMAELLDNIRNVEDAFPELTVEDLQRHRMYMIVEVNKRLAVSMSCFAFTLIGIPLGMKSRRKESSVGVGISLGLVFGFYLFIIISNALISSPQLRPDLIVWVPVIICEVVGFALIYRNN
jgi:lipopolysaccharide export system permease protein